MAAPKGHARYGGRQKGTPNKATAEVKGLAQKHGPAAIAKLAKIMADDGHSGQVAAIKELLDRGYGKATQLVGGDPENPMQWLIATGVPRADNKPGL